MPKQELLFYAGDLRHTLENHAEGVTREVEAAPEPHVLQADEDEWARALVERYSVQAPALDADGAWMDPPKDVRVDVSWDHFRRAISDPSGPAYVPGYQVVAHIPFVGDKMVFRLRPSTRSLNPPRADVAEDELRLIIEYPHDTPADIKQETAGLINSVEEHLGWARADIAQFNASLDAQARAAIASRRRRVESHHQHLAATGLPVGRPAERAKTYIAKNIVRRPAPVLPRMPDSKPMVLEPVLGDEVFEHILSVLRLASVQMERSPKTYEGMGEEDRRQVLLTALNTHYSGDGIAEAFNVGGKTDILVRHEGSNLFIGECKFWGGQKVFIATINQLLGYQAWRDTKLAIVMFVREKDVTSIIETARKTLGEHPQFVKWLEAATETELRAVVSWSGDKRRHADLNVFLVSTPKSDKRRHADLNVFLVSTPKSDT
jgi:hypothetical protein